jgi:hypothetical protein
MRLDSDAGEANTDGSQSMGRKQGRVEEARTRLDSDAGEANTDGS